MVKRGSQGIDRAELRRMARKAADEGRAPKVDTLSEEDIQHLLYEFGVYQSELLAQNEELKELRSELEASRDQFEELFEHAPIGYISIDPEGSILRANLTCCRMFDIYRSQFVGTSLFKYIVPEKQRALRKSIDSAISTLETQTMEAALQPGVDGSMHYVRLELRCGHEDLKHSGRCLVAVIDVTERVRMENDLMQSRLRAESAAQTKSEFLANMSHEIRTPMLGVLGMLQLLEKQDLEDKNRHYVTTARSSAEALLTVINDILDLSKIEAGKMKIHNQDFDLRETVQSVVNLLELQAEDKGLNLSVKIDQNIPRYLRGDEARIRQILFNLVGNSLKFTDEGYVRIRIKDTGIRNNGNRRITFRVIDSGRGIPKQQVREVTQPFVQADTGYKKKISGTGLGLAIIQRLVDLMNGNMDISSNPGDGTTVSITLPLGEAAEKQKYPEQTVADEQDQEAAEKYKLLLVEDSKINQMVIKEFLIRDGHEVQIATNGKEALQYLNNEDFDAVLMDVQMPEMDGVEATKRIRKGEVDCDRDLPIIALTAYTMEEEKAKFQGCGMDGHVSKPMVDEQLIQEVKKVISKKRESSE
jgi:PAS domain S-box-containing protein